jgi:hypothetical protein
MILVSIDYEIIEIYDLKLIDGNSKVKDVKLNLNGLLMNNVLLNYDKERNKCIF